MFLKNYIIKNININYNYFIKSKIEAGIVLEGWELKGIRKGRIDIKSSYVRLIKKEVWLISSVIVPDKNVCSFINICNNRNRKLLLSKFEINKLFGILNLKRYTIIPSKFYWKKNIIKVEICICFGKKLHDKRNDVKELEWKKEQKKALSKNRNYSL